MNLIRNFFSTVIGSLLALVLGLLIVLYSISSVLFDSKFILNTLEKNNTYKVLASELIPKVLVFALTQRFEEQSPDQSIADKLAQRLDKTTFEKLTPDLKKLFESSYYFVVSEKEQFEVRLELKNYLPTLQQNLTAAVSSLQTEGQLPGLDVAELNTNLQEAGEASLYITQDKIEVSGLKDLNTNQNQNNKSFLRQARLVLQRVKETQSLLVVAMLLLAVVLFATRLPHFLSGAKWLATTTISAAFLPLVLGFLLLVTKPMGLVARFLKEQESVANFSPAVDLVTNNLQTIAEKIFLNILTISAALIIAAVLVHILVFFLNQKTKHKSA